MVADLYILICWRIKWNDDEKEQSKCIKKAMPSVCSKILVPFYCILQYIKFKY